MRADLKMMMPVHRPFILKGLMFAPGAADFSVHDDFGMREEDAEIEGSMFVFVMKVTSFIKGFLECGVHGFKVDEGFVNGVDEIL